MTGEDSLWDIDEVAQYLKVTRDTIYRWIDKKDLPGMKIGKKWLFRRSDIDAWLDSVDQHQKEVDNAKDVK